MTTGPARAGGYKAGAAKAGTGTGTPAAAVGDATDAVNTRSETGTETQQGAATETTTEKT